MESFVFVGVMVPGMEGRYFVGGVIRVIIINFKQMIVYSDVNG